MKRISEYLIEAVARRTAGKYKIPLIFPEGKYKNEFEKAVATLKNCEAREFSCSSVDNYVRIITLRAEQIEKLRKRGHDLPDRVEFSIMSTPLSQPAIIVIGKGPLESGRIACVLRYIMEDGGICRLRATHFFEYTGSRWEQIDGPNLKGWGEPREHEEEINAMLAK